MKAICGAHCDECALYQDKACLGCQKTKGCPFKKKCWIAQYIDMGGDELFQQFKKQIIDEFNLLAIDGMSKIDELYPLRGSYVNLEYQLPSGEKVKFLDDNEVYLGNQVEYGDDELKKYFGLLANMHFLLVCEYEENGCNPEIIIYKRR